MGLGLSFGKNTKKTDLKTSIDKLESGTQSGTEAQVGQTSTSSTGTTSTQSSSAGTSTTSQQQNQTGNTQQSGQTTSQSFSDALAGGIEDSINQLLGGIKSTGNALNEGIQELGNFDPSAFVSGVMDQAVARQQSQLDQSINGLVDNVGGTPATNSMAALLANRLTGDATANLAGIQSQATAQGQQIAAQNLQTQAGAMASINELGPALIQALKGGNVTGTSLAQEIANVTGGTTGTTQTAEQSTQNQQTAQQQTQTMLQIIQQLLNTSTHTTGTETTKGKESKSGGGISLGI